MKRFERSRFSWIALPASLDSLEPFRSFVLEKADKLEPSPELIPNLELALEELIVNVISYAYPENGSGIIEVGCGAFEERMFCIQVRDYGKPFDPLALPDPDLSLDVLERPVGGLGVYLVRRLAETVHYEYSEESNQFTCCFRLD